MYLLLGTPRIPHYWLNDGIPWVRPTAVFSIIYLYDNALCTVYTLIIDHIQTRGKKFSTCFLQLGSSLVPF